MIFDEKFKEKHIEFCKREIRKRGEMGPFIVVFKGGRGLILPIPTIDKNHRAGDWIQRAIDLFYPDAYVFSTTGWFIEVKDPSKYKYGDATKHPMRKEILSCLFVEGDRKEMRIFEIKRLERHIVFEPLKEPENVEGDVVRPLPKPMGVV